MPAYVYSVLRCLTQSKKYQDLHRRKKRVAEEVVPQKLSCSNNAISRILLRTWSQHPRNTHPGEEFTIVEF